MFYNTAMSKTNSGQHTERHRTNQLSDIILGGQDGLVNVLGVILGVAAASQELRIILAAGLAATFAESVSMAAVAYTSKAAAHDFYRSEVAREKREMKEVPDVEREEIREIYRKKGFKGELLEKVVEVITSDEKVWLDTMMLEELQLMPIDDRKPFISAFVVGVSAMIGSLIPLVPFIFLPIGTAMYLAIGVSALTLFLVGAVKARLTVGNWGRSGIEMTVIGLVAALIGYGVGLLFQV